MALSETARLIASLELKDAFTKEINSAERALGSFDKKLDGTQSRALRAGQQIGVGIRRGAAIIASTAIGAASGLALIAKEGQHSLDVQNTYNTAIRNSGKITAQYVKALDAQALALSNLTGQDDELIRSEQTRLIQMGLTGKQITQLLPLILDAAQSTGRDLDSVTLAVGRAVQGSATSLGRLGIIVPKVAAATKSAALISLEQKKGLIDVQIAQAKANGTFEKGVKTTLLHRKAVLDAAIAQQKFTDSQNKSTTAASNFDTVLGALKPFQGVNQALSGSLDVKLKVFRERLQDIREEAGIKLLPSLIKITDVVTKNVLPAFQGFIDSILPSVIKGLDQLGDALKSGAAAKTFSGIFDTVKAAAPILQQTAQATFTIVKATVDLFTSLPAPLQGLIAGGFALNKLTGGLVTNIAGGLADLIGKSRGATPANPVFVADVSGGLGGAAGAGKGILGTLGTLATKLGGLALVLGGLQGLNAGVNIGGPAGAGVGALGAAATIGGGALLAGPAGAIVGSIVAVGKTLLDIRDNSAKQGDAIAASINAQITGGAKLGDLKTSLAAVEDGINQIQANPLLVLLSGDALDQLKAQRELLQKQVLAQTKVATPAAGNATPQSFARDVDSLAGKLKDDLVGNMKLAKGVADEFRAAVRQLQHPRSDTERQNAARDLVKRVMDGLGSLKNTAAGLAALKSALKGTHDAKTAAILRAAIAKVESKIPGREFAQKQIDKVNALIRDGSVTRSDLRKIASIEQALKDHGLPSAARNVEARVAAAQRAQVLAAHETTAAIKDKDLSVRVVNNNRTTVTLSISSIGRATRTYTTANNISSSAGVGVN